MAAHNPGFQRELDDDQKQNDYHLQSETTNKSVQDVQGWRKVRYLVALVSFWGFLCNYALRVNINLAIVEMVDSSNSSSASGDECSSDGGNNTAYLLQSFDPAVHVNYPRREDSVKFNWSSSTQSLILGSVFFGYITTQLIGGILAEKFGGKWVLGIPLFIGGLASMLTPLAAKDFGYGAVIGIRVIIGMAEGVTFPAMHAILAHWSPPLERSRMASMVYAGSSFGTIMTLASGGVMMQKWGWESIFYFYGALTSLWFLFWMLLVSDTPMNHKLISQQEKAFIMAALSREEKKSSPAIPWRGILTSVPFWALLVTHMGNNLGYWMLLTQLPTYMKNILHFKIQENGVLSSLPFVLLFICTQIYGNFSDLMRSKGWLSTTSVRKLANALGVSGLCLIGAAYVGCDKTATVVLFCIAGLSQGCVYSGYMANHLDLAPNFAGTLLGLTNSAATITSWTAPILAGSITEDNTIASWRKVFWICAVVMIFDAVEFVIFGSGEEQPWNNQQSQDDHGTIDGKSLPPMAGNESPLTSDAEEVRSVEGDNKFGYDNPAYKIIQLIRRVLSN